MRTLAFAVLLSLAIVPASAQTTSGWKLIWSDEFKGPAGSPPDSTKWNYDLGGGGWGNFEAETYTNSPQNVFQDGNGNLVIRAIRDSSGLYTSTRLQTGSPGASTHTADLSWQYGRIVARIKLPFGKGVWPAFWMLGENIDQVNWPACGEVDILETIGTDITTNHGSLHAPSYNPTGTYALPNGAKYSDGVHTFAAEWEPGVVRFYVDDALYETRTSGETDAGGTWEFDHPFFLLLNVAVGGMWPGDPDSTTVFPQTLKVDWVRVYTKNGADY